MILPQPGLQAKNLPADLLPRSEIIKSYKDAKQPFEFDSDASTHDRAYRWFYSMINGNVRIAEQGIKQEISSVYRIKEGKKEYLFYGVNLFGVNHVGDPVDFYHIEGQVPNVPVFGKKINPDTLEIEFSPIIHSHKTLFTIQFSKSKVEEISKYFTDSVQFAIEGLGTGGVKTLSCNYEEFTKLDWDELVRVKTAYMSTDYHRNKKLIEASQGGVR